MYQPSASKRRRRALSGKPRQKPKKEEQETSASEKESAQPAPTSSTPNAGTSGSDGGNGKTRQRRTRRWPGQSRAQSDEGFSYLRAATVAPERARSPASTSTRLGRKGDTVSQELAPAPSPKAPDNGTSPWPSVPQPSTQASIASFPNRGTPAESSLARLRALAGLTPLRMSSYDPQTLPSSLYRNEESPLRHSCDANSTFGGSDPSSTASSCVSSPYTPDLVRRLSFLNGTSAQTTLALLRGDRLKRRRSGEHKLPSPSLGPSFHNEEENAVRPLKGLPGVPTTSDTAASAGRSPFLTPSLCFTDLRDSTSSLYRNEEVTERDHHTGTECSSARLAPSLLSRLRASSPCLTSAAESGSNPHPYMTPKNGGSAVGGTEAPRELPTQSPWRSAATRLAPRPLAEPSTSPEMGVSQPSDMSARLAQLRERASTPSTLLPSGATAGPSSAVGTAPAPTLSPPPKTHFLDLSHLRGLTNLQQPHAQPSGQRSDVPRNEGREKGPSPAPAAARETALGSTLQQRLLAGATAAPVDTTPTPPAAIDSDEPFLGPAEGMQQRAARRHKSENVLTSSDHSTKENYNHTDSKASVRRAPSRKGAVRTTAKKESAPAAVVPKGRLAKGTRGSTCHTSTVMPSTAPKDKVSPAAVEGVVPCSSCSGRAKQLMNKLRSLAAPVPIGETAGEEKLKAVPNPFPVSAASSPVPSLLKHISQRPPSLEPNTAEKAHLRRNMSVLPPSWTSASPFAALASPSLHVALTKASADFAEQRGTTGSADHGDGVSEGEAHPRTPSSFLFTSVPPNYSYPSMMTRSAAVAAAKVTSATPTVAATSTAGMACVSSEAKTRTATTRMRKSSRDMKCVVFDTSSLLDSEPGVMSLLLERWFVGIPFTVLDELDRMHKACGGGGGNGKSDHVTATAAASTAGGNSTHDREWRRQRAHELRNWIASCLNNETQRHLLLQKRTEVNREYDRHATTNDDRILGYAVYLSQSQSAEVLFVTEDQFLRIKASSELGKAYAYTDVRKLVGMPPLPTVTPTASQRRTAKR